MRVDLGGAAAGFLGRWRTPRRVELFRVAPWLLFGPALPPDDYQVLGEHGVTDVIDLRIESSNDEAKLRALGFRSHRVPVVDEGAPTTDQFDELVRLLELPPDSGRVLYVHCQGGIGRSPTLAIALLMRRGLGRTEAYRLVFSAREGVAVTDEQDAWLRQLDAPA